MKNDLMRFSVAMPENLLMQFDQLVARRGIAKNRSEVVRDLVREALIEDECAMPGNEVMGTLTIVYSHHTTDLESRLHDIEHTYLGSIISTMHVHIDHDNCLEVIVLRGEAGEVRDIANILLGVRGVKTGKLVTVTAANSL